MDHERKFKYGWPIASALLAGMILSHPARGEEKKKHYAWDDGPKTIDVSKYPKQQQDNYEEFAEVCGRCHTLARAVNAPYALPKEWEDYVNKMKKKKKAHLDEDSAKQVLDFLIYDSSVRKKDLIEKKLKEHKEGAAKQDGQ